MGVKIDGPRLSPASGGKAKQLVVFCHGYGADGNDLIDIGRHWQSALPDCAFVSPHAHEACTMNPMGRQWFGLMRIDPQEKWDGVQKAGPVLNDFLDSELESHDVRYGSKPISDGITVDNAGNVYVTSITDNSIGVVKPDGKYSTL